tara:strand:+ start:948 stop:1160 length:213 start_codon:yes stop_codon:yes gene_type:complete
MDFNTLVTQHSTQTTHIIEDVIVYQSLDATSANVTLCGAYGKELATLDISNEEVTALEEILIDCNFIYTE